jgi:CBS domain-containing protein
MGDAKVTARESATVADAMLRRPKTLPAEATVADLRSMFENPGVRTALLVDGESFRGALDRDDLPGNAPDEAPALDYARADAETIAPDASIAEAQKRLARVRERRLVVVEGETLRGLLCADERFQSFCV